MVVDPKMRLSAKEALEHMWFKQDSNKLAKRDLSLNAAVLRKHLAKSRLKGAARAVIATNRFKALSRSTSLDSSHHSTDSYVGDGREDSRLPDPSLSENSKEVVAE